MKDTTYKWFSEHKEECFNTTECSVFRVISNCIEAHYGDEEDCNFQYCEEHNIPVYNLGRCGGTIACCDGTIGYAVIYDVKHGWRNYEFLNAFLNFLIEKGIEATIERNDVLINDFKVASAAEWRVKKDLSKIFAVHLISYDVDSEAIANICKKEMKKTPKGLKDFGLNKGEILTWCDNFFENMENKY